jgi:hypothetical protein
MSKPITPEEMKAWIDATWEKCQSEAWREPRQWVGLTDEETEHLWEISRAAMPRYHTFKTLIEKALRRTHEDRN